MATRRIRKIGLQVDERTSEMTNSALACRRYGHRWEQRAMSPKRYQELIKLGQAEDNQYCDRQCGASWIQIFDVRTGDIISTKREYPKDGYLMAKGSGRLDRRAARVAHLARLHPDLV